MKVEDIAEISEWGRKQMEKVLKDEEMSIRERVAALGVLKRLQGWLLNEAFKILGIKDLSDVGL